jgi:hypothetical protein
MAAADAAAAFAAALRALKAGPLFSAQSASDGPLLPITLGADPTYMLTAEEVEAGAGSPTPALRVALLTRPAQPDSPCLFVADLDLEAVEAHVSCARLAGGVRCVAHPPPPAPVLASSTTWGFRARP